MDKKALYGIIAIVVVAAIFGIYAATANTKTETTTGGNSSSTPGVGNTIISSACAVFGIKC